MRNTLNGKYSILRSGDGVVKAPLPNRASLEAAQTIGTAMAWTGAAGAGFGILGGGIWGLATYESGAGTAWGVFFLILDVVGVLLLCGGLHMAEKAEQRDTKAGILTAGELSSARPSLKNPMLEALRAADSIRRSTAYRDGWLTDIDVDAALWELAQHVKIGAKAAAAVDAAHAFLAEDTLRSCTKRLTAGAVRLTALAEQVAAFDDELSAPARRAELEMIRAELGTVEPALDAVADRLAGQLNAYTASPGMAPGNDLTLSHRANTVH